MRKQVFSLGPLSAFFAGALFSVGLVLSGMTRSAKVLGFLDFTGSFDPSLALVMGGALLVHGFFYRLIIRRPAPLFDDRFHVPSRRQLDLRLFAGAAIFGVGWGLSGYCPGPALSSLAAGLSPLFFVAAMIAGMYAERFLAQLLPARK